MRSTKSPFRNNYLLLLVPIVSLCTSGCALLPLAAAGTGAAGAGMQALGTAAGAVGVQALGEKVGDAMAYMQGGEHVADVTYGAKPALLKNIVDQTLQGIVSSPFVTLRYSRSDQESASSFVLLTSAGSELRIAVTEDYSFDDLHATQMIEDMEPAEVASQETETSVLVDALQEIDSKTQRQGIEKIRGEFNYASGFNAYNNEQLQQEIQAARQQQEQGTQT